MFWWCFRSQLLVFCSWTLSLVIFLIGFTSSTLASHNVSFAIARKRCQKSDDASKFPPLFLHTLHLALPSLDTHLGIFVKISPKNLSLSWYPLFFCCAVHALLIFSRYTLWEMRKSEKILVFSRNKEMSDQQQGMHA